jgi:hypothetical protein
LPRKIGVNHPDFARNNCVKSQGGSWTGLDYGAVKQTLSRAMAFIMHNILRIQAVTDRPESIRGKYSNLFEQVTDQLSLESFLFIAPEFIQVFRSICSPLPGNRIIYQTIVIARQKRVFLAVFAWQSRQ